MKQTQAELDSLIQTLPEELEPKRDLWQGIEQAVAKTPQTQPNPEQKTPFTMNWGGSCSGYDTSRSTCRIINE